MWLKGREMFWLLAWGDGPGYTGIFGFHLHGVVRGGASGIDRHAKTYVSAE